MHEIKGEAGHAVRIQRRGDQRPQYSLQLGRERRQEGTGDVDDRLLPFVQLRFNRGVLDRDVLSLVEQAMSWVENDAKAFPTTTFTPSSPRPKNWSGQVTMADLNQSIAHRKRDRRGRGRDTYED